jgi:hypothetical protein
MALLGKVRRRAFRGRVACGAVFVSLLGGPLSLDGASSLEYNVKAAFLLNFVRFVQWPATAFPQPGSPIAVCVLRRNPFGDILERMVEGEQVGGRPVVVRQISTPDQTPACHVLFVPDPVLREDGDVAVPMEMGLLTVGESDAFLRHGGIINFYTERGRVRFAINAEAAERSNLRVSARLLLVARVVQREAGERP